MYTKPLTRQPIPTLDISDDLSSFRRLLVAAAISPRFCVRLLENPDQAVRAGFGGERFPVSESGMKALAHIRVSTLTAFVEQLDAHVSNGLLTPEYSEVVG